MCQWLPQHSSKRYRQADYQWKVQDQLLFNGLVDVPFNHGDLTSHLSHLENSLDGSNAEYAVWIAGQSRWYSEFSPLFLVSRSSCAALTEMCQADGKAKQSQSHPIRYMRVNIVVEGGKAWEEEMWHHLILVVYSNTGKGVETDTQWRLLEIILSRCIVLFDRPNGAANHARKYPDSLNKPCRVDSEWTTNKIMLVWMVDLLHRVISLLSSILAKVNKVISLFPPSQQCTYKCLWNHLIGMLQSLAISVHGGDGLFCNL